MRLLPSCRKVNLSVALAKGGATLDELSNLRDTRLGLDDEDWVWYFDWTCESRTGYDPRDWVYFWLHPEHEYDMHRAAAFWERLLGAEEEAFEERFVRGFADALLEWWDAWRVHV